MHGGGRGGGGWRASMHAEEKKPKLTRELLIRVLRYARPYWRHLAVMLVMILLSTVVGLVSPLIFRTMIDTVLPSRDLSRLVMLAVALLILPILDGGITVVQRQLNSKVGEGVIYDLRLTLYSKLQKMSLRFFTNTKVGEMMSRLNNDVVGAQTAVSSTFVSIITNLIQGTAVLIVMLTLEWKLTLAASFILPLLFFIAQRVGNILRRIARRSMELNARMNAHMNETLNIGGALLVKLFGRSDQEMARFRERAGGVRDIGIRRAVIGSLFYVMLGLIGAVGTALVYGLGGWYVIQETFTVGTIVAFGSYLTQLYKALQGLAGAPVDFATSLVSFERVFEVVDLPLDVPEKKDPLILTNPHGDLEFENVFFNYDLDDSILLKDVKRYGRLETVEAVFSNEKNPSGEPGENSEKKPNPAGDEGVEITVVEAEPGSQARDVALQDISFTARAGQLVALVGPSGAGKTTITYLIPRLYDPTSGIIRIDGHDLRDLTLDSLAHAIGMVTQETYLFHDTILTNLTFARPDATQAEVEAAARAANIHQFVAELPDGYDTIVGERGYRLSGGEKQRIALARVILKDPRLLVLDEATSSLDSESEALIQDALKSVMAGRTSIVIAHRLSTILAADMILVLDRGRIVERGTHHELLTLGGVYSQLYETQFNRESNN